MDCLHINFKSKLNKYFIYGYTLMVYVYIRQCYSHQVFSYLDNFRKFNFITDYVKSEDIFPMKSCKGRNFCLFFSKINLIRQMNFKCIFCVYVCFIVVLLQECSLLEFTTAVFWIEFVYKLNQLYECTVIISLVNLSLLGSDEEKVLH